MRRGKDMVLTVVKDLEQTAHRNHDVIFEKYATYLRTGDSKFELTCEEEEAMMYYKIATLQLRYIREYLEGEQNEKHKN